MINLLPPALKQDYRFAQRNTGMRRWVIVFVLALVGLGLIATYGLATMQKSVSDYSAQVATAQSNLTSQKLGQTTAQVQDISNSVKLVVKVLSQEVLFSKLLKQIATVIPQNAILTDLDISQTTGAIDLSASTTDYSTATQVQVNLADPTNKIFSKADIIGITCATNAANPTYPCTVQIRALFGSNNQYLFTNNGGS